MERLRLLSYILLLTGWNGSQASTEPTETVLNPSSKNCLDSEQTLNLLPFLPLLKAKQTANNDEIKTINGGFGWICQKSKGSANKKTQYITLYDVNNNLPVYSAYITEPWKTDRNGNLQATQFKREKFDNLKNPSLAVGKWQIPISNYESYTGSGLDRGHLFAAQYATDEDQNKATYRITNTVPQDHDFNSNQWKAAETYMKDVAFRECQTNGGVSFVFTGAVTGFQDQTFEITKPDNPGTVEKQIPTHLWTTMICVQHNNILMHQSFIGSNYQKGEIVFYKNFHHFRSDLKAMYKADNDLFSTKAYNMIPLITDYLNLPESHYIFKNDQPLLELWRGQIVAMERARCLYDSFAYFMRLSGYNVDMARIEMPAPTTRNKRETKHVPQSDEKVSFFLMMINDTNPKKDLELGTIKLTELDSKTNKPVDDLMIDIKKKEHTEQKTGGTAVTFSFLEDGGQEIVMKKGKSTSKINIVLKPRN